MKQYLYIMILENILFKIAKLIAFINIIKEEFFDQLRTKEQLGYLVKCSINNFLIHMDSFNKLTSEQTVII